MLLKEHLKARRQASDKSPGAGQPGICDNGGFLLRQCLCEISVPMWRERRKTGS